MAPQGTKKRRVEDEVRRPKKKIRKFKKQAEYHSSSEDEVDGEDGVQLGNVDAPITKPQASAVDKSKPKSILKATVRVKKTKPVTSNDDEQEDEDDALQRNTALNMGAQSSSDESEGEEDAVNGVEVADEDIVGANPEDSEGGSELDDADEFDLDLISDGASETSSIATAKRKRNDPNAFATSISKILTTKLSTQKRADPILSRSKSASDANKSLADGKLEAKARASIHAEKRSLLEKGRVKDVLGLETSAVDTGAIVEQEKRLKKTAQRGVVKLFNAVRAAQVRGEEAARLAKEQGTVGMQKREEKVNEMSKEGFLELISRGGKATVEA